MAASECWSLDFEIKSPENKLFETFIRLMNLPKDNTTVTTEFIPVENKNTTYRISGIHISEWYKSVKETIEKDTWQNPDCYRNLEVTLTVIHVEENDHYRATLTMEYEKTSPDIEEPKSIMDTLVKYVKNLDEFLKDS